MRKKNAQVSFEFILIFALSFMMIAGFTYIINQRLGEINKEHEIMIMKSLANNIKSEVLLASSVSNNYLRRFDVPTKINGKEYKIFIENDVLTIQTIERGQISSEYFTVFPTTHVKGDFIENISFNNTEHCITKNDIDGIRIAKNQISLDANRSKVSYQNGDIIELMVSLNCVWNIRSAQFTISYDPTVLRILKDRSEAITYARKDLNPLFVDVNILPYEGINLNTAEGSFPYIDDSIGRYTFGIIGRNCATGSGNLARLFFEVIADPEPGTTRDTIIEFDPYFGDNNLIVLDCQTNKKTKEDMPDSKKSAKIKINSTSS